MTKKLIRLDQKKKTHSFYTWNDGPNMKLEYGAFKGTFAGRTWEGMLRYSSGEENCGCVVVCHLKAILRFDQA